MAFINEKVSEADIEKYGLRNINQQYHPSLRDMTCQWTIDRERDVYLRYMGTGREETSSHTTFTFFWKGSLFFWVLEILKSERIDGHSTTVWGLPDNKELGLAKNLMQQSTEIFADFKEAMKCYEQSQFLVQPKSYGVEFQF